MEYAVMTKEEQKMEHVIPRAADSLTLLQNIALIAGEYHLGKYVCLAPVRATTILIYHHICSRRYEKF
jgi:hypothetical protein